MVRRFTSQEEKEKDEDDDKKRYNTFEKRNEDDTDFTLPGEKPYALSFWTVVKQNRYNWITLFIFSAIQVFRSQFYLLTIGLVLEDVGYNGDYLYFNGSVIFVLGISCAPLVSYSIHQYTYYQTFQFTTFLTLVYGGVILFDNLQIQVT
eukprot:UN04253